MSEPKRNFTTEDLKTPTGKELAVFKVHNTSLYEIGFTSGGQIPGSLVGSWTDPVMAQKAIKVYLAKLENERLAEEAKLETKKKEEAANRVANVPKNTSKKKVAKKKVVKKITDETKA